MKAPDLTIGEFAELGEANNLPLGLESLKGEIVRWHNRLFGLGHPLPPASNHTPIDATRIAELLKG